MKIMALLIKISLIFSLLILRLFVNHALSDFKTQELIDKICRQMEDYGFCNKTFNANLKTPSTNIRGLTQITLELTIENVSSTFAYAESLRDNAKTLEDRDILNACLKNYETIINGFTSAFKAFGDQDYRKMLVLENPAPKAVGTCESSISFRPSPTLNPFMELIERNRVLRILIQMAIVSGHLLVS